ncbi:extracellular solute-binding protein [Frankia sp. CiP3]|uniref:extracellular solute-binding protein n=2 Tax=unclassified Frankia TaxID=2632575 RepID=UPI001EF5F2D3|nr:extracellular solute-binding protein [Frankia sp. CiP3]
MPTPTVRTACRLASAALLACLVYALGVSGCSSRESGDDGVGPITFSGIADLTYGHQVTNAVGRWNREHPDQHVRYIEQTDSADEQRAQLIATAQGSHECYDVHSLDVVWTAEFARGHLVVPLDAHESRAYGIRKDLFVPAAWASGRYRNQQWAVPFLVNTPLLLYRKDILDAERLLPPTSLNEMISQIKLINKRRATAGQPPVGGFGGQFARYEGLTVNALEIIRSLGGDLAAGPDTPLSEPDDIGAALRLLADGTEAGTEAGGWLPQETLTDREQGSRDAFTQGQLLFLRNWPYAYKLVTAAGSPLAGKVGVVPLPWSGVLGGHNLAVSTCSRHRATAWSFISYMTTNRDIQSAMFRDGGYPAALLAVYSDHEDEFSRAVVSSLKGAGTRPISPYYAAVSGTIQDAVHSVLTHERTPAEAVAFLQQQLPDALHGG